MNERNIMLTGHKNTKKQGDAGLGVAIGYFCEEVGYTVCVPLTDSQDYDLVIERDNEGIQKVQIKTTTYKNTYGFYQVNMSVKGGNSKENFIHKTADEIFYDLLFVVTGDKSKYLIPKKDISHIKHSLVLGALYEKYKI